MRKSLLALAVCGLLIAGCAGAVTEAPHPTATQFPGTPLPPTEAPPTATATEKPLSGPMATAQALAGSVTLSAPTAGPESDNYPAMIEHAWNLISEHYYDDNFNGIDWDAVLVEYRSRAAEVESQEEFWQLMDQFVGELADQHSNFRTPEEAIAGYIDDPGEARAWSGIQMWPPPGRVPDVLRLWDVCSNGPASDAGLERGDQVLAINGQPVQLDENSDIRDLIVRLMFGDGDSNSLSLTVLQGPDEEPRDVTLQLGGASGCSAWDAQIISRDPRIGYIRLPSFDRGADTTLADLLEQLEAETPLDALILDIRHNPGGLSNVQNEAVQLFTMGEFGTIGALREGSAQTIYRVRGPVTWNAQTPMAVLVDQSSHSAADYFAIAMKLSNRATLVGMPTAGNTDGWTSFTMPDGSQIGIAVSIYHMPDGTSVEGMGVEPDVRVPLGEWGLKQDPDVQLQAAIELMEGAAR